MYIMKAAHRTRMTAQLAVNVSAKAFVRMPVDCAVKSSALSIMNSRVILVLI